MAEAKTEKLTKQAEEAIEKVAANTWMERLARTGYAAKGVVYIVVGALATMAAIGLGGRTTDTRGALQTIEAKPFGKVALAAVAFGLIGYVLWRWIQALADTEGKGRSLKGIGVRIGYACSGTVYAGLSLTAAKILIDVSRPDSSSQVQQRWTERLMEVPGGVWLIELAGLCVVGFGLYQIVKGIRAKFRERLKLSEMSEGNRGWATWSGRFGYAARGVVFAIIGVALIQASRHYNPEEAKGLDKALLTLAQNSYGPWLLGTIAVGLIAYGCYMLIEARYRRLNGS